MSPVFILHANDQIHSKTYVNMSSDGSLFPPFQHHNKMGNFIKQCET